MGGGGVEADLYLWLFPQLLANGLRRARMKVESLVISKPHSKSPDSWLITIYRCKIAYRVLIGELDTVFEIYRLTFPFFTFGDSTWGL